MNNNPKTGKKQENPDCRYANVPVCKVCSGKKYTLVATRKVSHMSIVYERRDCPNCVAVKKYSSTEYSNAPSRDGRKMLSGTGYLRNKKRRRKDDDQDVSN